MRTDPDQRMLWVGAISGTSMDGIDCALVDFAGNSPQLVATCCHPLPDDQRDQLFALTTTPHTSLRALGELHVALGRSFAAGILQLLRQANVPARMVQAIGSHGQTVYHHPGGPLPFSMQLADPNTIAAHTGIRTVADFRGMDLACGGQGAPLAPLFHQAVFHSEHESRAVLNIGGISNLTLLPAGADAQLIGFDTGPGNALMDYWVFEHRQQRYDADGTWARTGKCHQALLQVLRTDPYFSLPAPKSSGREHFNAAWLARHLAQFPALPAEDVQATLLALTASTIADALLNSMPTCERLLVCGGGAHNGELLSQLQRALPDCDVQTTDRFGVAADWVEAVTFAWLAQEHVMGRALDCRSLTGSRQPAILGGCYQPASD